MGLGRFLACCAAVVMLGAGPVATSTAPAPCAGDLSACELRLYRGLKKANGTATRRLIRLRACEAQLSDCRGFSALPSPEVVEITEAGAPLWVWPVVVGAALVSAGIGVYVGTLIKN